jgi:hypothetical protein
MLTLSDTALAMIGATRVRASERGRWLQDVARRLDPPPARPLTRQSRWRQRQRNEAAMTAFAKSWRRE